MLSPRLTTTGLVLLGITLVAAPACVGNGSGASGTGGKAAAGSGGMGIAGMGSGGAGASGGSSGSGGMPLDAGTTEGDGGLDTGPRSDTCTLAPAALHPSGVALAFPVDLVYEERPFVFGEENAVSSTQSVVPLNLRFYVSDAELVTAGGGSVPVDIVTETGAVAPYGVFLFNAENPGAQTIRVRGPAGSYEGLKFTVGLTAACNQTAAAGKAYPLSEDSQMTWSVGFGYLFLRYESRVTAITTDAGGAAADAGATLTIPRALHMGGDVRDLRRTSGVAVRVSGSFNVPASGAQTRRVRLAMDQVFKAATSDVDLSDFPFAANGPIEIADGERLRRAGGGLPLFVFAP